MAENSKIEWTDHTFNPWWGCVKVSPGCKNCYASNGRGAPYWGKGAPRRFMKDSTWKNPVKWNDKAKKLGIRYKVFCGSMCDFLEHRKDLVEAQDRLFDMVEQTPWLDWLMLSKRLENAFIMPWMADGFPDNVWLGTSIENQEQADIRIPELLKIDAKVRFLSCEPLLEEIDISKWLELELQAFGGHGATTFPRIDWVIVGGESGLRKRPFNPDWARSLRDQCKEAGVPYFFKQIDKVQPIPDDLMIREFPNG